MSRIKDMVVIVRSFMVLVLGLWCSVDGILIFCLIGGRVKMGSLGWCSWVFK